MVCSSWSYGVVLYEILTVGELGKLFILIFCWVLYFFSCFSWFVIDRTDTKWNKSKTPCTLISIIISEWLSKQTNNAWSVFIIFLNNIMYCSYKTQNILKLRAKVYQFELILILLKSNKLPLFSLVQKNIFFRYVLFFLV